MGTDRVNRLVIGLMTTETDFTTRYIFGVLGFQFVMFVSKLLSRRTAIAVPYPWASAIRRSLFIETANTPNPESIKFLPGTTVYQATPSLTESTPEQDDPHNNNTNNNNMDDTRGYYATRSDKNEISKSPLMQRLFKIDGIKSIYLGLDFITVTKFAEANWAHVRTPVFSAIMDHFASGSPAVSDTPTISDTTILDSDSEVVAMIKEILETRIRPAVQEDGGDIRYVGFDEVSGIVSVKLAGSCVGCPSSSVTLKNGVENMLIHYIPEVLGVHAVQEDEEEENGEDKQTQQEESKKMKTYEQKLAAAGIPFSD
jgi:Fe-S cluster biogenesis protein NfuA